MPRSALLAFARPRTVVQVLLAAMTSGVTTPGQVGRTAAGAIAFGLLLAFLARVALPNNSRAKEIEPGSFSWWVVRWILPGVLVAAGVIAEIVALIAALNGTVWHTGN